MDGQSLTPDKTKFEQLKAIMPEAFSEGKIDWEKLKATLGEDITFSYERYVLNWAGKSEAFIAENMVYELLLKSGKDPNSKVERVSTSSTAQTDYYKVNDNELVFMLEKASQDIVGSVLKEKPLKVVALDKLFKGNDQLKTNTVLQLRDAGVEFKTI